MITVVSKHDVFRAVLEDTPDGVVIRFLRKEWNRDTGVIHYAYYGTDRFDVPFHVACDGIQTVVDQLEHDNPESRTVYRT